jgi:hypothetical protein
MSQGLTFVTDMLPAVLIAMLRQFAKIKPRTPAVFIPMKQAVQ